MPREEQRGDGVTRYTRTAPRTLCFRSMRFFGLRFLPALCFLGVFSTSQDTLAQTSPRSTTSSTASTEAAEQAQLHFKHARDLYQDGSYREAFGELEAAHALDPQAKDLVFNLSLVAEKLGRIDEALRYMRVYGDMNLEAAERARAESSIRRLEGARRETPVRAAPASPSLAGTTSLSCHCSDSPTVSASRICGSSSTTRIFIRMLLAAA